MRDRDGLVEAITRVVSEHDLMSARRCACGATFEVDAEWTEAQRHVAERVLAAIEPTVHASPPLVGGVMPCCGRAPREVGPDAVVSLFAADVTCHGDGG